jgi:hypothetical protein
MCPIAGGNWNNSNNAGVWTLNLNNVRGNSNNNSGFRADSAKPRSLYQGHGGTKGDIFRRVDFPRRNRCVAFFLVALAFVVIHAGANVRMWWRK